MKILRKVLKIALKIILGFAAFFLIYFLTAFVLSRIQVDQESPSVDELDIYILTNGVHTDIVVPVQTAQTDWFSKMNHLQPSINHADYNYLAIGWGDKGFYLNTPSWAELKASTAIKATMGLSGTAVHATFYKEMVESETCNKISISKEQYARLIGFIDASLAVDNQKKYIKIATNATKGDTDAFYEATGRYSLFNTCNSWANKGLMASGQKACLWTAFQGPIFLKYEE